MVPVDGCGNEHWRLAGAGCPCAVERWALDEVPLPGRLVHQIAEWPYRENRFCRGALIVLTVGPSCLDVPTLAVVNTADEVAPLASIEALLDALPTKDVSLITYPGEIGVALQHLGILVGREAYARVWPNIIAWLAAHRWKADPAANRRGYRFGHD
jgi:poly[(R)-3-hydroxyalkanoate] polymerase subunit PhaC